MRCQYSIETMNKMNIPLIGFGTYDIPRKKTEQCVRQAIELGYRLIDTAQMYNNEAETGTAVRNCGIKRDELFVQTKISSPCHTVQAAIDSFHQSFDRMKLDYIDLMLIHWPQGGETETWKALEQIQREGLVKHIGVSNFYPRTWEELCLSANVKPCLNQIECNIFYQQRPMLEYMAKADCMVQAWQPLGEGTRKIFSNETLIEIGNAHKKTATQIALRFLTQQGISVIPRSQNVEHMNENINILDFVLTDDEMNRIRILDTGHTQYGWPSDAWSYSNN